MGSINVHGVYEYDETDDEATFSDLLNLQSGVLTAHKAFYRGPAVARAALEPAPPASYWQDEDGDGRLWSSGPDGFWRLHEGVHTEPAGAFAANGAVFSRDFTVVLPTVLAAHETLLVGGAPTGSVYSTWFLVNQITRGPASTTITIRQFATSAGAQICALAWRIVGGA